MDKEAVAAILDEIALLLELKGENPFKSRAYSNAARTVEALPGDLAAMARAGRLTHLPGIGDAIRAKLTELLETGRLPYYERLRSEFPPGIFELLAIPGLGPRKLRALYSELGVDSPDSLERACLDGRVADLKGFGATTQAKLLEGIARHRQNRGFFRLGDVMATAATIRATIREWPEVSQVDFAGEFRRGCEILREISFVASSRAPDAVLNLFCSLPGTTVIAREAAAAKVTLRDGLPCALHVTTDAGYPFRLLWMTGGDGHLRGLARIAAQRGAELTPDGLAPTPQGPLHSEADVYAHLGLARIPPELREDQGEIEAALGHELPRLIEWTDLRGTFHNHTTASDGSDSLEQMAAAARDLGMEYLGIADHSHSSAQARGLDEVRLLAQVRQIRALNDASDDLRLLAGSEVDILKDGTLDFPDDILAQLDYAVASIHSHFGLDEDAMTRRIIRAAENPHVTMLGHLTGRLLLERPPYAVDAGRVIDACAATGTWIEINANPRRLDMDWRLWRRARDRGVIAAINPDAHSQRQLAYLRIGVGIARKGWLRKSDVANTRPLPELLEMLAAKRRKFSPASAPDKSRG